MCNTDHSSPGLVSCQFVVNTASTVGGGISNDSFSCPELMSSVIAGNEASYGGGISDNWDSDSQLTNCVLCYNQASGSGGGVWGEHSSSPTFDNCIVWGNTAGSQPQICNYSGVVTVTYSCVEGGWTGVGNIAVDPLFVDAGVMITICWVIRLVLMGVIRRGL